MAARSDFQKERGASLNKYCQRDARLFYFNREKDMTTSRVIKNLPPKDPQPSTNTNLTKTSITEDVVLNSKLVVRDMTQWLRASTVSYIAPRVYTGYSVVDTMINVGVGTMIYKTASHGLDVAVNNEGRYSKRALARNGIGSNITAGVADPIFAAGFVFLAYQAGTGLALPEIYRFPIYTGFAYLGSVLDNALIGIISTNPDKNEKEIEDIKAPSKGQQLFGELVNGFYAYTGASTLTALSILAGFNEFLPNSTFMMAGIGLINKAVDAITSERVEPKSEVVKIEEKDEPLEIQIEQSDEDSESTHSAHSAHSAHSNNENISSKEINSDSANKVEVEKKSISDSEAQVTEASDTQIKIEIIDLGRNSNQQEKTELPEQAKPHKSWEYVRAIASIAVPVVIDTSSYCVARYLVTNCQYITGELNETEKMASTAVVAAVARVAARGVIQQSDKIVNGVSHAASVTSAGATNLFSNATKLAKSGWAMFNGTYSKSYSYFDDPEKQVLLAKNVGEEGSEEEMTLSSHSITNRSGI